MSDALLPSVFCQSVVNVGNLNIWSSQQSQEVTVIPDD